MRVCSHALRRLYLCLVKIVFLNIWHNKRRAELASFITKEAPTTDIFCFQEADSGSREAMRQLLPGFTECAYDKTDEHNAHIQFGQVTYVKTPAHTAQSHVLLEQADDAGLVLVTRVELGDDAVTIANVHGISFPEDDKLDTTGRLVQSETIIDALAEADSPVIIGGDFNMLPEADSIQMFTDAGYQDLIASHQIKTTRNRLAWERWPDNPQFYADYAFTSPVLQLRSFTVPLNEISDHLPLIIEFDIPLANKVPVNDMTAKARGA